MIAKMDRVEIVFLRSEFPELVPFIQAQGVMHLEDVPLAVENHPGYLHAVSLPEDQEAELAQLQQVDALLKESLPLMSVTPSHSVVAEAGPRVEGWSDAFRLRAATLHHRRLRSFARRALNIQDNLELIKSYGSILQRIQPLLEQRHAVLGETARAMVLDGYSEEGLNDLAKRFVREIGPECDLVHQPLEKKAVVAVVTYGANKNESVSALLEDEGIIALDPPAGESFGTTVIEVMKKTGARMQALQEDLEQVKEELTIYSQRHGDELTALAQVVSTRLGQLNVYDQFAQSDMIGVIHGWVPSESFAALNAGIKAEFGDRVAVEQLSMSEVPMQSVPTLRENHPLVKPFELMMGLMKPPTYGHFDPTVLVAVSFSLFYGFILGDMGYAMVVLALAFLLRKKMGHNPMARSAAGIMTWMGISTFIFGAIYLEFFGDTLEHFFPSLPILFHRGHETTTLLAIAILFGVVHVVLALVLGIRESYAHNHNKHGDEKLGMLLGLVAIAVALMVGGGFFPLAASLGYVLAGFIFIAALFYLFKGMGPMAPMGVMELVGLSANILSYARLMALGMAGLAFAEIANSMTRGSESILMAATVGILGAALVHSFNIGLGVFSPTIHSLRLNIVEFLPKFYEPAGKSYEPFRKELAW